jgi:uncharacterized membrane protein YphA (DoxX/SURF4 family)
MKKSKPGEFHNKLFHLIGRLTLGGIFIYASMDKIAFPKEFAEIVMNYHILPQKIAIYFAFLLPWIELILGIFLVVGLFVRASALTLSSLLIVFLAAVVIKRFSGVEILDCGCFSVNLSESGNIFFLLFRDLLLLFLGIFLSFRSNKYENAKI